MPKHETIGEEKNMSHHGKVGYLRFKDYYYLLSDR
jgi:hypothetical protein